MSYTRRIVTIDRNGRKHITHRSMGDDSQCSGGQVYDALLGGCVDASEESYLNADQTAGLTGGIATQSGGTMTAQQLAASAAANQGSGSSSSSSSGTSSVWGSIGSAIGSIGARLTGSPTVVPGSASPISPTMLIAIVGGVGLLAVVMMRRSD